jgi:AcrR family transcriptional regulator
MKKDKRELLLDAAMHLFVEKGFQGTSTYMISKTAGVATGTLFNYFKTKEDLINSLYLHIKSNLSARLLSDFDRSNTIRKSLYIVWENFVNWAIENPYMMRFYRQFSTSPFITNITIEQAQQGFSDIYQLILEGQSKDIIKNYDTEMLLDIVASVMNGTATYFINNPSKFQDELVREQAFNIYWDSIKF